MSSKDCEKSSKGILSSVGAVELLPPEGGGVGSVVTKPALPPPLAQPPKPINASITTTNNIISTNFFDLFTVPPICKTWTSASHFFCI